MHEKITAIREVHDIKPSNNKYQSYDGFEIETEDQTIQVLIDNEQSCCENWGYLSSDDDLEDFVGATLVDIRLTDTGLNERMVEAGQYLDEGDIIFVTFRTDRGVFQLAVYNGHNGYYGHHVRIVSEQMNLSAGV